MYGDNRRFGARSSSVDPQKLASTVTGVIKAVSGGLALLGYTAVVGDVNSLAEVAGQFTLTAFSIWGIAETGFGLVRKIIVHFTQQ